MARYYLNAAFEFGQATGRIVGALLGIGIMAYFLFRRKKKQ